MDVYLIKKATLTGIANAIREKVGSSDGIDPEQMEEMITGIQSGGGAPVVEKDVNFYDYDGTLVYSYTVAEAQALTELPAGPEHEGLIFQKWNWSLENVKALTRAMNIGALYTTDDGTTRLYIHLEEGRTSPMLGVCPNGTVTVDWGDGTTPDTLTGTSISTVRWTPNHEYAAPGDYVIQLTVDGEMGFAGDMTHNKKSYVLRYSDDIDARNGVYQNALQRIELGDGVKSIGSYAFSSCHSLSSIVIPDGVKGIDNYAFDGCFSLSSIVIPDGVKSTGDHAFYDCSSLSSIVIPDGVTSISAFMFYICPSLSSIVIPDGVTSIGNSAFSNCDSLSSIVIPDGVTSIGNYAFSGCDSLSSIVIPDGVTSIGNYAFDGCSSLSSIVIPDGVTSIGDSMFKDLYGIRFYDFSNHTAVPTLSAKSAFINISADCEIRVPAALYDEWIAATNWSTYASQIVAV